MVRRNFFADMRYVENSIQNGEIVGFASQVFDVLVDFVSSCEFSKSKNSKFICENWRLGHFELQQLWNNRTGSDKSVTAFRGQISDLSATLFSMFPTFSKEAFLYSSEENYKSDLEGIVLVIDSLSNVSNLPKDIFIAEVVNYPENLNYSGEYSLKDCEKELAVLKAFKKSEVYSLLDEVDLEKMKFILSTLNQPLFRIHSRGVNNEKLEMLKRLEVIEPSVTLEDSVASSESETKPSTDIPYRFDNMAVLSQVITDRMKEVMTPHEIDEWTNWSPEEQERQIGICYNLFYMLTSEGLGTFLHNHNINAVIKAARGELNLKGAISYYKE